MIELPAGQRPSLLNQVRQAIRVRRLSLRIEQAYVHWIKRYIPFHGKRHPLEMGAGQFTGCVVIRSADGWRIPVESTLDRPHRATIVRCPIS